MSLWIHLFPSAQTNSKEEHVAFDTCYFLEHYLLWGQKSKGVFSSACFCGLWPFCVWVHFCLYVCMFVKKIKRKERVQIKASNAIHAQPSHQPDYFFPIRIVIQKDKQKRILEGVWPGKMKTKQKPVKKRLAGNRGARTLLLWEICNWIFFLVIGNCDPSGKWY